MKKETLFWIVLLVLFLSNLLLTFRMKRERNYMRDLEKQVSSQHVFTAQKEEELYYSKYLFQKNMEGNRGKIVLKEHVSLGAIENEPHLYVRYNINACSSCLSKFLSWVKRLGDRIGNEHIILLQAGGDDVSFDSSIFPDKCKKILIDEKDFYVRGYESSDTPYLFIYEKGLQYPLLFCYFPNDIIGLDEEYENVYASYFKWKESIGKLLADVEKCDTSLYIRNAVEKWSLLKIKENIPKDSIFILPTGKLAKARELLRKGSVIRYPDYEESEGNCCAKSHLDLEYRFP